LLYDELLATDIFNKQANAGKGIIAYLEDNFSAALSYFTKALGEKRDNVDLLIKRASCLCNIRSFDQAKVDIEEALKLEPSNIYALMIRGQIYINFKEYGLAIQDLNKFVQEGYKDLEKRTPEEVLIQSHQKSHLLEKKADCYINLFLDTYPQLRPPPPLNVKNPSSEGKQPRQGPNFLKETVTEEFILDLKKRLDIAKNEYLTAAFRDLLASRTTLQDAKTFIDPKLNYMKSIVNQFLRL